MLKKLRILRENSKYKQIHQNLCECFVFPEKSLMNFIYFADNIIVSGSTDRTLKVWDANTGLCLHTLHGHTSTVRCMHLYGER